MASRRKPSTPVSSQRFITCTNALTTRGLSKLRSGWCEKKRCQENWPASGSQVQFDFSVSVKMIRVPAYFWSVSLQTYQLRALDFGSLRRARLDHWCWSDTDQKDRESTRLNSSHAHNSDAGFCLLKKK